MSMHFDEKTKEITVNRGDRGTVILKNTIGDFKVGDKIKFSIVEKGNYNNVVFQKRFVVTQEGPTFPLTFTKQDMTIGPIISKDVTYWYEVEYNGDSTLLGFDKKKGKKFILFPEAPDKEGSEE
ncbi:MAG: hypothetical protein IKL08_05895 [Clostridia bacterium]|nr:hypothetical protein [Clostridia bacterium]